MCQGLNVEQELQNKSAANSCRAGEERVQGSAMTQMPRTAYKKHFPPGWVAARIPSISCSAAHSTKHPKQGLSYLPRYVEEGGFALSCARAARSGRA